MRYLRRKQLTKLGKHLNFNRKNFDIDSMRIIHISSGSLDESFEWRRSSNYIKFYVYSDKGVRIKVLHARTYKKHRENPDKIGDKKGEF